MKNISFKFIIGVISFFLIIPFTFAENKEPEKTAFVIGTGKIHDKNTAKAREEAISYGMALAVEQIALKMFPSEDIAQNFSRFNSILKNSPDIFVENYKVLAELSLGQTYRIMLQVSLSPKMLKEKLSDIKAVQKKKEQRGPEILFLISEQNLTDISPVYWWADNPKNLNAYAETAMSDKIKAAGFPVIDHGTGPPDVEVVAAVIFEPELDNREALNIGKKLQADIIIIGKTIVYKVPGTEEENIPSFNATLTARAVHMGTGKEIASILETKVKKNADEIEGSRDALRAAGAAAGEKIASQISSVWRNIIDPADLKEVIVNGTKNLGNFVRFRKILADIEGVKSIQIREMKSDNAVIVVNFEGKSSELKDALISKEFETFNIAIKELSENNLSVDMIPK